MTDEKKVSPATASVFANALASTPRYVDAGAAAKVHERYECARCGAPRERSDGPLACRYCGHALVRRDGGER